jgi:hypothetical protein
VGARLGDRAVIAPTPVLAMARADARHRRGDIPGALQGYASILQRHHDFIPAFFGAGIAYYQLREYAKGKACFERVLRALPLHANTHYNYGVLLQETGDLEGACQHYRTALGVHPHFHEAATNLGSALLGLGQPEAAIEWLTKATQWPGGKPEARFNRAFANLSLGRYREGWDDYEGRWRSPIFSAEYRRSYEQLVWKGEPHARLFLWAEQGYGDTIMMWRFLPQVVERLQGGTLIVEVQTALKRLLAAHAPAGVTVLGVGDPVPDFDRQLPMMSLPHTLGLTLDTIPPAPYLMGIDPVPAFDVPGRKIGLVWSGARKHRNDANRSIPPTALAPLFQIPGIAWYALQPDRLEELEAVTGDGEIRLIGPHLKDFGHTAAALEALDLIVTVDTSVAHLAGALGRPTWVLLSAWTDWRWMLERTDTPWYPSVRLIRQQKVMEWGAVIDQVAQELAA